MQIILNGGWEKNIWLNYLKCLLSTKDYNQSCVENVDGECLWESYRIGPEKKPIHTHLIPKKVLVDTPRQAWKGTE